MNRLMVTQTLIFIVDGDHPEEHDYTRVARGHQMYFQPWCGLSATLNTQALHLAQRYQYVGFLGDDHRPRTKGFDTRLIGALDAVGSYGIVYGADGRPWHYSPRSGFVCMEDVHYPMTWWVMNSRVINLLGQMVPWPLSHTCVDDYVWQLGYQTGNLWFEDVVVEHLHPLWGKAETDESYELSLYHHK